jgi:hypothetical protein
MRPSLIWSTMFGRPSCTLYTNSALTPFAFRYSAVPRVATIVEAHLVERARVRQHAGLVEVVDRDEDGPARRDAVARGLLRLGEGDPEVGRDAHHLARRLHLGPQQDVGARELQEREHRLLHEDAVDA